MNTITYKTITDGNVEICKDLCNGLMQHQASKAKISPEVLKAMDFETRLKPSFEGADIKQLIVAYDGEKPIGYVFSTVADETEESKTGVPAWAKGLDTENTLGFYPAWFKMPAKVGCLSNLYVMPEYRGKKVGEHLSDLAMDWLKNVPGTEYIYVYVSNGNEGVIDFYKKYGFEYSHDVFGGFIVAYYQEVK